MHFISLFRSRSLVRHREGRGGMYRKITGAVTNKTFGMAGLPPEFDELSFRRNPPRKCAHSSRRRRHLART
jgi:hypothetical protein